jgi:hypothetical protein
MSSVPPRRARLRALFVGNSYTSRHDLPRMIARLLAAAKTPVELETQTIVAGGASLRRHWNAGRAQQAIESKPWDFVVLQEQSTLPVKNRLRYHENVRLFDAAIRAQRARTVLYLVWARKAAPDAQRLLDLAARELADELGARVVPVGPAWETARRERPELALSLYADDGSHPTLAGSYLAACVFANRLAGIEVSGWSVSDALNVDRDTAALLHAIAARQT